MHTQLHPHPRLYASPQELKRLRITPETTTLEIMQHGMQRVAEQALQGEELNYDPSGHNSLLIRARTMQQRVVTLAAMWWQTGEECYVRAVMSCVHEIAAWEYWSWIAMRKGDAHPDAIFDLSCGENSATLAIAYDWLFEVLAPDQKKTICDLAARRSLQPFLHNTQGEQVSWWLGRKDHNWNTVCAGGAGMLALALYEELPEAAEVLGRVEASVAPFMHYLETTVGGWPEGIGYWNYGMRYAFMYLLSWENATGRKHPLLELPSTHNTLNFPLDFTPNGCPASFGDAGGWHPLPFHYAAAARFGDDNLVARLDEYYGDADDATQIIQKTHWPDVAEFLVFHPRRAIVPKTPRENAVELYEGLGWGFLAAQMPNPNLYVAVRGGSTNVSHSHRDLMSFHCILGDESMIENIGIKEYLDSTFSARRNEIFEVTPASKNTILINGVGIEIGSEANTSRENYNDDPGIRVEATAAMGTTRDGPAAKFCGRAFLLLDKVGVLVVDHVVVPHYSRIEARFWTPQAVEIHGDGAFISGKKQRLQIVFAADAPAVLQTAQSLLTSPVEPPRTLLRWATQDLQSQGVVFATLLTDLVASQAHLTIRRESQNEIIIEVQIGDSRREVWLNHDLFPSSPNRGCGLLSAD